jgi:hypothetical protein
MHVFLAAHNPKFLHVPCTVVFQVFWQHPIDPNLPQDACPTGYGIKSSELSDGGAVDPHSVSEYEVDAKTESYEIEGLKMDTRYEVMVRAKTQRYWGLYGDAVSVRTKIKAFPRFEKREFEKHLRKKGEQEIVGIIRSKRKICGQKCLLPLLPVFHKHEMYVEIVILVYVLRPSFMHFAVMKVFTRSKTSVASTVCSNETISLLSPRTS